MLKYPLCYNFTVVKMSDRLKAGDALTNTEPQSLLRTNEGPLAIIKQRIESCRDTRRSNCIGTALFLTAERDHDLYGCTTHAYKLYLANLRKIATPIEGCFAAWHRRNRLYTAKNCLLEECFQAPEDYEKDYIYTSHLAVVISIEPERIMAGRVSTGGIFQEQNYLATKNKYSTDESVFYLPRIME
jgi:hypothetical protein